MLHAMLSISKDQVPEYLRSSPFFANTFPEGDDLTEHALSVEIPADCFKPSPDIHSESDLLFLLRTVRFWLIPEYIENEQAVFELALTDRQSIINAVEEFGQDLPFLLHLNSAVDPSSELTPIGNAAKCGMLSFAQYLRSIGHGWVAEVHTYHTLNFTSVAARHGQVHCLQYALENGCILQYKTCILAAAGGHLDCLKCAHEHGARIVYEVVNAAVGSGSIACVKYVSEACADRYSHMMRYPARQGNIQLLRYMHSVGYVVNDDAVDSAAAGDHLDCLQFLISTGRSGTDVTLFTAVYNGSIVCTQYLHNTSVAWPYDTLRRSRRVCFPKSTALGSSNLHQCLVYAAENGCPVTSEAYMLAIERHQAAFLVYLFERGIPYDAGITQYAVQIGNADCLRVLLDHGCPCDATLPREAVQWRRMECLQLLLDRGCPCDDSAVTTAVKLGQSDCLQCLHDHDSPFNAADCNLAAALPAEPLQRSLEQLRKSGVAITEASVRKAILADGRLWLTSFVEYGYVSCGPVACAAAAACASLSYLHFLHEHGVGWDISTCRATIRSNSIEAFNCLEYAVNRGCPMDVALPEQVVRSGSLEMLKYLHKKGCPWDERTTAAAVKANNAEMLRHVLKRGCPVDVSAADLTHAPQCREVLTAHRLREERKAQREQEGAMQVEASAPAPPPGVLTATAHHPFEAQGCETARTGELNRFVCSRSHCSNSRLFS